MIETRKSAENDIDFMENLKKKRPNSTKLDIVLSGYSVGKIIWIVNIVDRNPSKTLWRK